MRILYIESSMVPPSTDPRFNRFSALSRSMEGAVLHPLWYQDPGQVESKFGPYSYPVHRMENFTYHWFLRMKYPAYLQQLASVWFCLFRGWRLHRELPFDCIVTYSHMTTAVLGCILKLLTGAKLVVEVVTAPHLAYLCNRPRPSWKERALHLYSDVCLHLSVRMSDHLRLLSPKQLAQYPSLQEAAHSVCTDYIPVRVVAGADDQSRSERYILLVGAPWYLKGVDRLITAFQLISDDFPDVRLKLLGHYPDREALEELAKGSRQIEVLKARPNPETLKIISGASVLVLPSRTEGVPRVLIEGMAAGVPLIGSDVGGIPYIVRDGENGFVIPDGDPVLMARRLRQLLEDPDLAHRMGAEGRRIATTELNEDNFVWRFTNIIRSALGLSKQSLESFAVKDAVR